MHVNDFWDLTAAILTIALVAVVLTKKNTSQDVSTAGKAFTSALSTAENG